LILVSAYAGWAGSLPADMVDRRLRQAIELSELSAEEFVDALLPTMFSEATPKESIDEFAASMRQFHPVGFRAMARASAEDLRDALPLVDVPTLLIYGDNDVRAPLTVADHLHAAIAGSKLAVLSGAGHVCNVEAPDQFNETVRGFLHQVAD
jgi:pimeloyl-ACP methyl ester carboxylesterase